MSGARNRFGRAELPEEIQRAAHRATVLEWATIGWLALTVTLVALVMGSSQAMKAAWIEDLLSFIPPIAFLVALRRSRRPPAPSRPYGDHRAVGVGHLVSAVALTTLGLVLLVDSAINLLKGEHPAIGTMEVFGHAVWQGWLMIAVMLFSTPGSVILGRMKMKVAETLHDRVLHADAAMNKADWQSQLATVAGVAGVGLGLWWFDSAAAIFVGVGIVKDGWANLREAIGNLADRRATTVDGTRPHPLLDRAERVAWAQPWVRHAGARARDEGHVFHVEMFVVPHEGAGATVGRCADLREQIRAIDWKLEDVVVVPVAELPEEVHGGGGREQSGGSE